MHIRERLSLAQSSFRGEQSASRIHLSEHSCAVASGPTPVGVSRNDRVKSIIHLHRRHKRLLRDVDLAELRLVLAFLLLLNFRLRATSSTGLYFLPACRPARFVVAVRAPPV